MPAKFVKSLGRCLDARPDRLDLRDRDFAPQVESLPPLWPDDAQIRRLVPAYVKQGLILDQGTEGACTGFGLACVIQYLLWRRGIAARSRKRVELASARMLYHLARFYDEWDGEDYEGSSCRGALKAWHKHGVCSERLWPYRDPKGKVRFIEPKQGWDTNALSRRLGVYYRVNRASVVDLQAAILQTGAIYVSADAHDGWDVENGKPIKGHASLPVIRQMKKRDSIGGHAFALVGFNPTGFVVQNSWGETWGNHGFAILPYEEWVDHGTDAWVCALGVPGETNTTSTAIVRNREAIVLVRAGGVAFTTKERPARPAVIATVAPWPAERAYQHTVLMGNDGRVISRIVTHESGEASVQAIVCDAPAKWLAARGTKKLVIYAHGGLNPEESSIERIRVLAPYFAANGIYPLFLTWRTGTMESLAGILEDELAQVPRPERGLEDVIDRIKETASEVLDRTIEVIAGPVAKPIWSQMKQNAAAAADPGRGSELVAKALATLHAKVANLEIHLVGHSAGSILLGHLLDCMGAAGLAAASCSLYAPACTLRFALDHYKAAIDQSTVSKQNLWVHVLSDHREREDTVGPRLARTASPSSIS